jgi:hypothetical protein
MDERALMKLEGYITEAPESGYLRSAQSVEAVIRF